jgi:hypothetical protein
MSNFNNWHTPKTYFLEDAKETKNATFVVLYSAKWIYEKYKMVAE